MSKRYISSRHRSIRYQKNSIREAKLMVLLLCGGTLLVVFFIFTSTSSVAASPASTTQTSAARQMQSAQRPLSQPTGSPAIRPRTTLTTGPAFTESDVQQYVTKTGMPHNLASGSSFAIMSVTFMTSREVVARLQGEATGLPDTTLLCFVELQGTFVFAGPQGTTGAFQHGYEVFDAHTGNILMWGGLS